MLTALLLGCGAPEADDHQGPRVVDPPTFVCSTEEPRQGDACETEATCAYSACGRVNGSIWSCEAGAWKQLIRPGC